MNIYKSIRLVLEKLFKFSIKSIFQLVLRSSGDELLDDVPVFAVFPHQLHQLLILLRRPSLMTDIGT